MATTAPKDEVKQTDAAPEPVQPTHIPYWRLVADQAGVTPEVANFAYPGSGTEEDPYRITWIPRDPRNPMLFSNFTKWFITMVSALTTLAVALVSSAYTGGIRQIIMQFGISQEVATLGVSLFVLAVALVSSAYTGGIRQIIMQFGISQEVATLGVSLFVLGFAIGPLLWAPLSEVFGRQWLFFATYAALTAFNAGCAGAQNAESLIILRFFAGAFGSSPLTNAGGVIADMFPAAQRGVAMAIFAAAPFLGPVLGPIIGGFLGMNAGWRWVMGFLAAFSGLLWIMGSLLVPETYAPVLLRKRAAKLSKMTGKVYVSKIDHDGGRPTLSESFKTALSRPWILLFKEPIVLLLSIYMAIVYGTLYMLFAAFPIVYQVNRGWNQGVGGLSFLGIMVGMLFAVAFTLWNNKHYIKVQEKNGGAAPPEARLPPAMIGSVALPVGLFWFAWTNSPNIHWMASIAAGVPFGFGMVLVFLSILNYLIDAYTIFAASVLAANSVLRSCFGAAFPLFTTYMYNDLGIHWASSVPAFLALACVPFPFLFYKYGAKIRASCNFAAQSEAFMKRMMESQRQVEQEKPDAPTGDEHSTDGDASTIAEDTTQFAPVTTTRTRASSRAGSVANRQSYNGNPYAIDRVNTRDSFA